MSSQTLFLKSTTIGAAVVFGVLAANPALARDQIQIVGSSTVFPFSTAVAEQFGQRTAFRTPVVESTGTGGGMKLFCSGLGERTPDMTNASRRIKMSEYTTCRKNGVTPVEVKVGFDGIVLANSRRAPVFKLTLMQVFQALAAQVPGADGKLVSNPYVRWSQIDPSLPDTKIEVLGPPPTSGTRDAFVELAMEAGANGFAGLKALRGAENADMVKQIAADLGLGGNMIMNDGKIMSGKKLFQAIAHGIREDGVFVEAGENDNLIVQKLEANPNALGIFGFSFLDQNADKIQGAEITGTVPTFDAISSGDYPVSRSLYFYVKKEHVGVIPGIAEFLAEFTSEDAWGDDGYLSEKGLIPLPEAEREKSGQSANALEPLVM